MGSLKRNQKFRLSHNLLLNSRILRVKDQCQEVESDKESELQRGITRKPQGSFILLAQL